MYHTAIPFCRYIVAFVNHMYAVMILCVTALNLGILPILCTAQQSELTDAPFDGLVPENRDPNSEILSLTGLTIPLLDNTSFVRYSVVVEIHMVGCSVTSVKSGTFDTLWRLQFVDFRYNNFKEFPVNFGLASQSLVEINLWRAFALRLPQPLYFRNFLKLNMMNLGFNHWKPFDPTILPTALTIINLNFARLNIFPNFTNWTPNLREINIVGNTISEIPRKNIQNMNITHIKISANRLMSIPDYTAYPYIINLLLRENRLTSIPDFYNTTLKRLEIANNPLICDYALCWIRMWPWMFDTLVLADTATCASPSGVAGKPLMEVRPVHMKCHDGKPVVYLLPNISFLGITMVWCYGYTIT